MEAHIKVQENLYERIFKAKANFRKSPKDRLANDSYLSTRLDALEEQWSQFILTHTQIVQESDCDKLKSSSYTVSDLYGKAEELYIDYKFELREARAKLNKSPAASKVSVQAAEQQHQSFKLPKIAIPSFSGKYAEWTSFRDLFLSLIHNNATLDDVQRLHYLKCQLTGEAEQFLRHIPITAENYKLCWKQLEDRYSNKKYLANCILKKFMSQKSITIESATALRELLDTTNECMHALTNLSINVSTWDTIVIYVLCSKLDAESRKQWELKTSENCNELPTFKQFQEFLEIRSRSLEFIDPKLVRNNVSQSKLTTKTFHVTNVNCMYCSEEHHLRNCKKFAKEMTDTRRKFVQSHNLCFNCLGAGHNVYSCRQSSRCRICKKKHHSLLHSKGVSTSSELQVVGSEPNVSFVHTTEREESHNNITACFSSSSGQVLLATALVNAKSHTGSIVTLRCLIDQGSQASFISEAAVQLLGLKKIPHKSSIFGIGSDHSSSTTSKARVEIQIQSLHRNFKVCVQAFVLNKLTSVLPERKVVIELWPEVSGLVLADPSFKIPNKIDMLLGADIYSQIIMDGLIKNSPQHPIAQNTQLGWILSGPIQSNANSSTILCNHIQHNEEDELLKKFWELESDQFVTKKPQLTEEEIKCEQIFVATTRRDRTGRYIVNLPFRDKDPSCKYGNSKSIATKQFYRLEKRLLANPKLKAEYSAVIADYKNLGHTEQVPLDQQESHDAIYLPHHAVVREDKDTTKVRVVFNASCPGSNGVSLNDHLMVGPSLQLDLRHIIMRWRRYPICLVADIIKMYRQVKVTESHTDYQRFVWRENPNEELQHLRLLRVTFGTASAPYLAVRALQQVAHDDGKHFPLAAERVLQEFYMDDFMSGCYSVQEGKQVYVEMTQLLSGGGFSLQKWSSNSEEILKEINEGQEDNRENLKLKIDDVMKILGLTWNRKSDEFEYAVQLPPLSPPVTKRKVISEISRLFDPLGWLAPVIISAKIFIQKLWLSGIEWDDQLPSPLLKDWLKYRNNLKELTKFSIPRWIHTNQTDSLRELHGFCDASNDAFAAVVYLRVVNSLGKVSVSLITSKTKVAPIKQVSIPRLELCGAVILTRLLLETSKVMDMDIARVHAWTDSQVVLAWLKGQPSRWKTFVANRVSEIITTLQPYQWHHVATKLNPADCASRDSKQWDLQLWVEGPKFLKENKINYKKDDIKDTTLEEKNKKTYHTTMHEEFDLWGRYSSLQKLIRVVVYCRRFLRRKKSTSSHRHVYVSSVEMDEALNIIIRRCQDYSFSEELKDIAKGVTSKRKGVLTSLNPFVDDMGILRVGGRLQLADINDGMKHPIIIPNKSSLTNLLISDAHQKTLHGGPQLMINYLRTKYWIIGVKNLSKHYARTCVTCIRHKFKQSQQLMGQLPSARVSASRPFSRSGVDYAGPIQIRTTKGRGHRSYKGYICLFICMATRAVHIEAVSDLTTQGFLSAFKRFVARRGHCSDLWSDNGTNFVGASRELKSLFIDEKSGLATEIANCLASNNTNWHFIPPHAPNFGGLWEAGIKSAKYHLKRVIGDNTLTFEELSTVLAQIEACLNSRPMTQICNNAEDPFPLTPGHFLVGEPLLIAPDNNYKDCGIGHLRRWQLSQRMVQNFWHRWSLEYLTQFHHRYKWAYQSPEPKVGDIVLVKEIDLPPAKWLYGVIIEKHPGLDGVTRVVSLRCKGNVIKRPVSKLCVLPVTE